MKLIVGLGNPGNDYATTRHNIGFVFVDDFVKYQKGSEKGTWNYENKRKGEIAEATIEGKKIIFLKPMEFMNRSGGAVSAVANFYKIEGNDILVIHDEIDLPVGKIQLKLGGSSAGHNGLKSIIEKLGTKDPASFWRLRIGVDRPEHKEQVADYVLGTLKKEEKETIENKYDEVEQIIQKFISM